MNIANRLTIFRVLLIPLIVLIEFFPYAQFGIQVPYIIIDTVILTWKSIAILVLFCIASLTDFLDGYLARSRDMVTVFGKFLDPIADKLLVNTLFIIFAVQGVIPVIPVLLMIWRDTVVDAVRMLISQKGMVMAAGYLGKMKTVAQMVTIILILAGNLPFALYHIPVSSIALWLATIMSLLSGASYLIQSRQFFVEE